MLAWLLLLEEPDIRIRVGRSPLLSDSLIQGIIFSVLSNEGASDKMRFIQHLNTVRERSTFI